MSVLTRAVRRFGLLAGAAVLVAGAASAVVAPAAAVPPDGTFQDLTLINGWSTYPGARTPAIDRSSGIVHLKGMILTAGQDAHPFVIPPHWRPDRQLMLPVAMCAGRHGRLTITPGGQVTVGTPFGWNTAACLTSLEGVSYIQTITATRPLAPAAGWTAIGLPGWTVSGSLVHLTGELQTSGPQSPAFTVPEPPAHDVYLPIGVCNGETGLLHISPSGDATPVAVVPWGNYQCLVSLDGVSYWAFSTTPQFAPITLQNGWQPGPQGTNTTQWFFDTLMDTAALNGAMYDPDATTLTSPYVATGATVPVGRIQVLAATCGQVGQVEILPNAHTKIWPGGDGVPAATCMTSLDGIQYALNQQG